jgi:Tol biopolymer transport system component
MARSRSIALVGAVLATAWSIVPLVVGAANPSPAASGPVTDGEPWVVYDWGVGPGIGLRLVRTDGTDDHGFLEGLTPGEQWHPDWSPDGTSIAFVDRDVNGTQDLWVSDLDASDAERIYDCTAPCGYIDDPAWSPDGRSIMFQRATAVGDAGLGVGTVDVIDLESRTVTTLVTGAETEYFYVPRWAPDMHAIVVELDRFDSGRLDASMIVSTTIAVIDLSGAGTPAIQELLPIGWSAAYPDWGPDGAIVFQAPTDAAVRDGASDLYTIDPARGDVARATVVGGSGRQALQPTWTPDGDRIIFVEQDGPFENLRMSTILPDGTELTSATYPVDMSGTHPRLRPGD